MTARRDVHGVLWLDKPAGVTSNRALQVVKRRYRATKAGHTGSLDPLATGMLPICFGEATKLTQYMLAADTRYRVVARLGQATATGDAEGAIVASEPVPALAQSDVERVLAGFCGDIAQVPPMYSALKHDGRRLYELARAGVEVEREPRTVTIYELALRALDASALELDVRCSKGTYIRTLVEDIAVALGTVAHVTALRRLGVGIFDRASMTSLEVLEAAERESPGTIDQYLLPVDSGVAQWPRVVVDPAAASRLAKGQRVTVAQTASVGLSRLYTEENRFLGIGEIRACGEVVPKRMFPALGVWS